MTWARPEPGAPRSRVKHFTTESLRSLLSQCAVIELTKYLHLEKILYFLLKSVILPRNNYHVTYATDSSISGFIVDYHGTEPIS